MYLFKIGRNLFIPKGSARQSGIKCKKRKKGRANITKDIDITPFKLKIIPLQTLKPPSNAVKPSACKLVNSINRAMKSFVSTSVERKTLARQEGEREIEENTTE